jgi:eukaryotic-like serine/threonine-protein kinase
MDLSESLGNALAETYEIERELGGGGMARVFLARDRRLGRRVVIKTVMPELLGELSTSRFEREMMLAASLQHPHILPVLTAGVAGDVPYYTMPFVEGSTLRARLDRESRLPIDDIVRILTHLATAMAYAHKHDVIHRDIKPDNILLSDGIAVVTDFGVAKALSVAQPRGATLTSAGTAIGTPAYMAPEQAAGDACDARSDIYAFGVVAYEMLVGMRPFEHASIQRLIAAQLTEQPKDVSALRDDVPAEVARMVMRCLAKEPSDRPATSEELVSGLRSFGSGASKPGIRRRRVRPAYALAATLAIGLAALAVSRYRGERAGAAARSAAVADVAAAPAIAVLPFENL